MSKKPVPNSTRRPLFILLSVIALLIIIFFASFIVYQTQLRRRPNQTASTILQTTDFSELNYRFEQNKSLLTFAPQSLMNQPETPTGIIFYSGAFVDPQAYAPFFTQLAQAGYYVFAPQFPFNLANLSPNQAQKIIDQNPQIQTWVGIGHSLGGTALSKFVSKNPATLNYLLLLASYPDSSLKDFTGQITTVLGSNDQILNESARLQAEINYLPGSATLVTIPGANHSQFGDYLNAPAEKPASISATDQQNAVIDILNTLLNTNFTLAQPTITVVDELENQPDHTPNTSTAPSSVLTP